MTDIISMMVSFWDLALAVIIGFTSFSLQAFLLHPDFEKSSKCRYARLLLTPLAIGGLCWFGHRFNKEFLVGYPNLKMLSLSIGCNLSITCLRSLVFGFTSDGSKLISVIQVKKEVGKIENRVKKKMDDDEKNTFMARFQSLINKCRFTLMLSTSTAEKSTKADPFVGSNFDFMIDTVKRIINIHLTCATAAVVLTKLESMLSSPSSVSGSAASAYHQIGINALTFMRPWLRTYLIGQILWTTFDMTGSFLRLGAVISNIILQTLDKLSIFPFIELRNLIDLNDHHYFFNFPNQSKSLKEFWGKRWHSQLKVFFIETGSTPLEIFVKKLGFKSQTLIDFCKIMGAFISSAIIHEVAFWYVSTTDLKFKTSIFFLLQGIGACLETFFKRYFSYKKNDDKKVKVLQDFFGRLWCWIWVIFWGRLMVESCLERKIFPIDYLCNQIKNESNWFKILTPFYIHKLIFAPPHDHHHSGFIQ